MREPLSLGRAGSQATRRCRPPGCAKPAGRSMIRTSHQGTCSSIYHLSHTGPLLRSSDRTHGREASHTEQHSSEHVLEGRRHDRCLLVNCLACCCVPQEVGRSCRSLLPSRPTSNPVDVSPPPDALPLTACGVHRLLADGADSPSPGGSGSDTNSDKDDARKGGSPGSLRPRSRRKAKALSPPNRSSKPLVCQVGGCPCAVGITGGPTHQLPHFLSLCDSWWCGTRTAVCARSHVGPRAPRLARRRAAACMHRQHAPPTCGPRLYACMPRRWGGPAYANPAGGDTRFATHTHPRVRAG